LIQLVKYFYPFALYGYFVKSLTRIYNKQQTIMKSKKELIEWVTILYNEGNCSYEWYDRFLKQLNNYNNDR